MTAKLEELKSDLEEFTKLSKIAERQKVKDVFLIEIRKLETEIAKIKEAQKSQTTDTNEVPKKAIVPNHNRCYDVKLTNYAWDQSDKFVKIFVTLKNVQTVSQDNVHCNFEKRAFEVSVKCLDNRNYSLGIKNLLEDISTDDSKWKVKTDMVVIFLAKAEKKNWSHLTSTDKKAKEPKTNIPKMDTNEDPTADLMSIMKQMYEDGDDDLKRTIAQSWTESQKKNQSGW